MRIFASFIIIICIEEYIQIILLKIDIFTIIIRLYDYTIMRLYDSIIKIKQHLRV